jgi:hypothetical protein
MKEDSMKRLPDHQFFNERVIESLIRMRSIVDYDSLPQRQELPPATLDELREAVENLHKLLNPAKPEQLVTKQKILFLAADPQNETRLRLTKEFREIEHNLSMSISRAFTLCVPEFSVRKQDLSRRLLQEKPRIVHFSGHGKSSGSLCFERDDGNSHEIEPQYLDSLFELHSTYVKCVILNSCYSHKQAKSISKHIDFVVGMNAAISDQAAIDFSIGFYQAIGEGMGIKDAYEHGCASIASFEKTKPILLRRS